MSRRSFTLAELLIVVMVIGILASTVVFALYGATQEAKLSRTKTEVAKLHELLMTRWESYRTRPIRVNVAGLSVKDAAKKRLNALHELMRLEMPERIRDVIDLTSNNKPPLTPQYLSYLPSLSRHYWSSQKAKANITTGWTDQYAGAECLYIIVSAINEDGESALRFFLDSEIGDKDGDGMPEIQDGWGNPIEFLRWAPGFVSESEIMSATVADPFDPLGVYSGVYTKEPFAMYPLIFSAGPDGIYDIAVDDQQNPVDYSNPPSVTPAYPSDYPYLDSPAVASQMGTPMTSSLGGQSGYTDNVTNHFLGVK
jgi:prepilin-type N-terminal cleavage/methylation domain-containing protein